MSVENIKGEHLNQHPDNFETPKFKTTTNTAQPKFLKAPDAEGGGWHEVPNPNYQPEAEAATTHAAKAPRVIISPKSTTGRFGSIFTSPSENGPHQSPYGKKDEEMRR